MNAVNAEKLTVGSHLLLNIREHTLERNPMGVVNVLNVSVLSQP